MTLEALLFQALNGLAAASSLFFVGAGLSLIFGVTRIINIAHGSFYMLGLYLAATLAIKVGGGFGFWGGILAAGLVVAALGGFVEMLLLRRIYQAPELFCLDLYKEFDLDRIAALAGPAKIVQSDYLEIPAK